MFIKPNIEKLKEKRDIQNLGKFLQHKNRDLQLKSANALFELLRVYQHGDKAFEIVKLFKGIEDKEIRSIFIKPLHDRIEKKDGTAFPYDGLLCEIVLETGGAEELIKLHQKMAGSPLLGTPPHVRISRELMKHAALRNLGIAELLEIIPYAVCQFSDYTSLINDRLERGENLKVPKEKIEEIKDLFTRLPSGASGLENYIVGRGHNLTHTLGGMLLSKLEPI